MIGKALVICKAYPPVAGGVETFSEQITRAYMRAGVQVTVITQTDGNQGWQPRNYPEGDVLVFNTGPGGQVKTALRMFWRASQTTRQNSFDFYHATTWRPALALGISRLHSKSPLIVTVHGREVLAVPRSFKPIMRRILRTADLVVVVSDATRTRVAKRLTPGLEPSKWLVAHNGLSFTSQEQIRTSNDSDQSTTNTKLRILSLSRLVERKNIKGCIKALQELYEAGYRNIEYRIAGTGPLLESLKRQVDAADLTDAVQFLGYVKDSDIPDLYQWADVFLHPQIDLDEGDDFEGFGLSIADAMSFGCLAIAGAGSGPSEFIESGVNGILVDGKRTESITQAIRDILNDRPSYKAIADKGRTYVLDELSWDKHIVEVLDGLLARTRSTLIRPGVGQRISLSKNAFVKCDDTEVLP